MRAAELVPLALGALFLACAGADTSEEEAGEAAETAAAEAADAGAPGAVTADPEHYAVDFENDAVRLVRITYPPGESSVMHRHPAACAVFLTDATFRMTDTEGEVTEGEGAPGEVSCSEAAVHLPENAGEEPAELVLVEFKEGAAPGTDELPEQPGAVAADPDHYTVEFENDVARLVRITYAPGETSAMHRHPAGCAIFLADQPTRMELPTGEVEEPEPFPAGTVQCGDASAHLPTNVGDGELELILVELKGRATLGG